MKEIGPHSAKLRIVETSRRPNLNVALLVTLLFALVAGGCAEQALNEPARDEQSEGEEVVLVGAGDIARCEEPHDEATAGLIEDIPGTVFTLGDNAYQRATKSDFEECYDPSWGRFKDRTRPAAGNHEYAMPRAKPHFEYFGEAAGEPGKGYYSYNIGTWHVVVLNSNCSEIDGGCMPGSPQERWLRADLEANRSACTLAYFHHPRFASGEKYGDQLSVRPFWKALYDHGADVVLSAHEHNYERFAPQTPHGELDGSGGIRQFVVGTGGGKLYGFGEPRPNSQVRESTYGVLKLTLLPESYEWKFVPTEGDAFVDAGSDRCVP